MFKKIIAITFAIMFLSSVLSVGSIMAPASAMAPPGPQGTVTVDTITANNETIHMMVTVSSSDNHVIKKGDAPLTFTGTIGKTYSITVSDQLQTTITDDNQTIFNHWQNDNTTLPTQTITLSKDTDLTAIFNKGETIPIRDIGILQLAAHDLYDHTNATDPPYYHGDNLEDERLNLSTLLDYGQQNIATGGEMRNVENIITFTIATKLGHEYLNYLQQGMTPLEARELTVQTFMSELKSAYSDAFHEPFPESETLQALTFGSTGLQYPNDADADLGLRTLHSFVPGHIMVNGTLHSILDPSLVNEKLDDQSLNLPTKPLDGTYDPALLNITEQISPTQSVSINLQSQDAIFGEQFHTDFTLPQLLNEIRDGSFGQYSDPWGAFREALEHSETVILLNATSGLPGATVGITGVNFDSNSTYQQSPNVTIQMNDGRHAPHIDTLNTSPSIITASNGIFGRSPFAVPTVTFTVPSVPPGVYTIFASNGNESASLPFTVLSMHDLLHGPNVGANIATVSGPENIEVNENTNTIYSANFISNSTSVIDGKTNNVTATIPLSGNAAGLAIDPISDKIYVENQTKNKHDAITVIDGKTNKIVDVIPLGPGPSHSLAVDYNTHKLYVANYSINTIIIDTNTDKVIGTIPNNWADFVAVNEKTDKVYVTDDWDNVVDVINSKTDQVIDTINVGTPTSPNLCWTTADFNCNTHGSDAFTIWINENTNTIYEYNEDGSLVAIDGNTDKIIYDIPVETVAGVFGAVNDNTNTVYTVDQLTSDLYVINGNTGKITDSIEVGTPPSFHQCRADPTCHGHYLTFPIGIAVNDKTGKIYVADYGHAGIGSSVIVLDTNTHGKNLSGQNLQGANLSGEDLQGDNLQGDNLSGANLQGANLNGANLQGDNLQNANLQNTDLSGATLQGANLQNANLTGANVQNANLQGANTNNITPSTLSGCLNNSVCH